MATATRTTKGFAVTCPCCGDPEATVKIDLNDLAACECSGCGEEFSPAEAVARLSKELERWEKVARWAEMAGE